jgi:hypothetical protein
VRTGVFTNNVYGVFFLEDENSVEASVLTVMSTDITGPMWGSDIRPGRFEERFVTV